MMKLKNFGDVVDNLDGKRIPLKSSDRDNMHDIYPYYGASGIIDKVDNYIFDGEYLLISEDGANLLARTYPIAFIASGKFWVNNHAHIVKAKEGIATNKYLEYFLNTKDLAPFVTGSAQPKLNQKNLNSIRIPLPPLETQKKIAAILDAADAYRQKTKALIAKYEELTQSLFLEMFGDPVRNEKGWEKSKMGNLMTILRGGSPRPIDNYLGGEYPWIKIGDATKGDDIYLSSTKQKITADGLYKTRLLPPGSLIFANCGVSLGFARIIKIQGCIHDGWLAFSEFDENKINKIFLLKALNSVTEYFRRTAPDGTQPNLNISIMKNFELILPPIKLQEEFEKSLELLIEQKAQAQQSLEKAEELFASLLQRAFKGELV